MGKVLAAQTKNRPSLASAQKPGAAEHTCNPVLAVGGGDSRQSFWQPSQISTFQGQQQNTSQKMSYSNLLAEDT